LLYLVFFPNGTVTFPEVLLADALTSMSKVLKDFGVTLIVIYSKITGTDIIALHDVGMIIVAIFASIPFWYENVST
jgi:hypothetical protein